MRNACDSLHELFFYSCNAEAGNSERQIDITQDRTLRTENLPEHTIQSGNVDSVLRIGLDSCEAHQLSYEQDREEERDVRVSAALDFESRLFEHAPEFRQTIAPPVIAHVVLQTPQEHERR